MWKVLRFFVSKLILPKDYVVLHGAEYKMFVHALKVNMGKKSTPPTLFFEKGRDYVYSENSQAQA